MMSGAISGGAGYYVSDTEYKEECIILHIDNVEYTDYRDIYNVTSDCEKMFKEGMISDSDIEYDYDTKEVTYTVYVPRGH